MLCRMLCLALAGFGSLVAQSESPARLWAQDVPAVRPVVPGKFLVQTRRRVEDPPGSDRIVAVETPQEWNASETALVICDMWNDHYCKLSAQRVGEMVPRMNAVLTAARSHGAMIIHSPSGTLDFYEGTPHRNRMKLTPKVESPFPLQGWCHRDEGIEPELPVDVSKSPCDDPVVGAAVRVFSRQHAGLDVIGFDGISDSGDEIYSFCTTHGIKNIVMMGVHTNMCVLGRPFGIRQLTRLKFNVVLARDLTDAMYDPRQPPFVSHARGTEMVIEHIERYWCPSISGEDLAKVIAGSADPVNPTAAAQSNK